MPEFNIESYTGEFIQRSDHHLYIAPSEKLKDIVAHYTITFVNLNKEIKPNSVLHLIPDVSGCLVFQFDEPLFLKVWGPTTKVVTVNNDLNTHPCRFFVEFLPGGLYQILGKPIQSLLDQQVDLIQLDCLLYEQMQRIVESAESFDELVAAIDQLLCQCAASNIIPEVVQKTITLLYHQNQSKAIAESIASLPLSERQLNRYFNRIIGMSMKRFSRIVDINQVIQELCERNLLDLAYDYEFFDQAHFNHVFKQICETTPSHYLKNMSDFYNELFKF